MLIAGRLAALPRVRVLVATPSRRIWARHVRAGDVDASAAGLVRELVCEQLRPGVYAEWSDPREQWRRIR